MLAKGIDKLASLGIDARGVLWTRTDQQWPFEDGAFDVIVSFYSFEHMYPFAPVRAVLRRLLATGGVVAGAIPCEGGLAWGLGRMLTSRRWFLRHTDIDPDKIICWEHPNFADTVLDELAASFGPARLSWWPLGIPSIDMNLVVSFIYERDESLS
jgi:SAM-dependent methyltransferase